jgi:hypothetical protein
MLKQMLDYYKIRFGGDEGATAVEYGLMVALDRGRHHRLPSSSSARTSRGPSHDG